MSLDDRQAVLEIAGLGTLHVERTGLHRIYRVGAADLIFAGPGGLDGWQLSGPETAWRDEAGQLRTDQPGAAIRRSFRPPPLTRYEFALAWSDTPNFELAAGLSGRARISVDSYPAGRAEAALAAGATIVYDISGGLLVPELLPVAAAAGATVVLGHLRGTAAQRSKRHAVRRRDCPHVGRAVELHDDPRPARELPGSLAEHAIELRRHTGV